MRRSGFSFEQAVSYLVVAGFVGLCAFFVLSYPGFSPLDVRSETPPLTPDEVYKIALNGRGRAYTNLYPKVGRNPFLPGTELQIYKTTRIRTPVVSTTRTPSTRTPPPPTQNIISVSPTPVPFKVPVTLSGFYKPDEYAERMVILRISSTGELVTARVGEVVAGMTILEITPIRVSLRAPNGSVYVLEDPRAIETEP
ncbi:MAG: hypothetical protein WC712_03185 [Candidatus Brocadiia bacterium]